MAFMLHAVLYEVNIYNFREEFVDLSIAGNAIWLVSRVINKISVLADIWNVHDFAEDWNLLFLDLVKFSIQHWLEESTNLITSIFCFLAGKLVEFI